MTQMNWLADIFKEDGKVSVAMIIQILSVLIAAIGAVLIVYQLYFQNKIKQKDEIRDRLQEVYVFLDDMNNNLQKVEIEINNGHADVSVSSAYAATKNEVEHLNSLFMHMVNSTAVRKVDVRNGMIKFKRRYFKKELELELALNKAWEHLIYLQHFVDNAYELILLKKSKIENVDEIREALMDYYSSCFKRLIEIRKNIFISIFFMGRAKIKAKKSKAILITRESKKIRNTEVILRKLPSSFTYINFITVDTNIVKDEAIKITKSFERFLNVKDKSLMSWETNVQFMHMFSQPTESLYTIHKFIKEKTNENWDYYSRNKIENKIRSFVTTDSEMEKKSKDLPVRIANSIIEPTMENFEKFMKIMLHHFDAATVDYYYIETFDQELVNSFFECVNGYLQDERSYANVSKDVYFEKFPHTTIYVLHDLISSIFRRQQKNRYSTQSFINILKNVNVIDSNKNKASVYNRVLKSEILANPSDLKRNPKKVVYDYTYAVESNIYRTFLNPEYPIHTIGTITMLTKWMNKIVNLRDNDLDLFNYYHFGESKKVEYAVSITPVSEAANKKEFMNALKMMYEYLSPIGKEANAARLSLWEPVEFIRLASILAKIKDTGMPISLSATDICEFAWIMWEIENGDNNIESKIHKHTLVNNTWI